jgi:hypothetical protein
VETVLHNATRSKAEKKATSLGVRLDSSTRDASQ